MRKFLLIGFISLLGLSSYAELPTKLPHRTIENYYANLSIDDVKTWEVKDQLFKLLTSYHKRNGAKPDQLVRKCNLKSTNCFRHKDLGYKTARKLLFGKLHLEKNNNTYSVLTRYCAKRLTDKDFPRNSGLGKMKIPDHNVMNAEHTWPQKRFSKKFRRAIQKDDLHSLYPTTSHANNARSHMTFGQVVRPKREVCDKVLLGSDHKGNTVFQPWAKHRGDVARALFYFSTRYKIAIDPTEEHILRKWHWADQVTKKELDRNDQVFAYQWNRNPFVDFPELVDKIPNF